MDIDSWAQAFAEGMHLHLATPPADLTELVDWGRELWTKLGRLDPAQAALEVWQAAGDDHGPSH